jgi:hypothetical protein
VTATRIKMAAERQHKTRTMIDNDLAVVIQSGGLWRADDFGNR